MKTQVTDEAKTQIRSMIPYHTPDLDALFLNKAKADRARAVLQLLFFIRQRMKENKNFAPGVDRASRYCTVQAETLKKIAGKDYRKIIVRMIEADILEIKKNEETGKEKFFPKKLTKLYRIHPKLKAKGPNGKYHRLEFITTAVVIGAIRRYYHEKWQRHLECLKYKDRTYTDIALYSQRFSINIELLEQDINENPKIDHDQLLAKAHRFNDKSQQYCHVDDYGLRLHTPLANLPKMLRNYLSLTDVKDQSLVIADVKNSQPYFLSLIFYKPELINLIPEFLPIKHLIESCIDKSNIRSFHVDCLDGTLYKKCFVLLGNGKEAPYEFTEEKKKVIKTKLFQHVFYGNKGNYHTNEEIRKERNQVETRFRMLYPAVHKILMVLKGRKKDEFPFLHEYYQNHNKSTKMYTLPSCMAQRLESKILLRVIAAIMFKIGKPVFTIHDAFIIEECHLEALKQVFEQTFNERLGVDPPTIEVKRLTNVRQ